MRSWTLVLVTLCLGAGGLFAAANPSPLRWKLAIRPDTAGRNPAARLSLEKADGSRQVYWYFVYTVENTHEEAVSLHLHVRAETDASDRVASEGHYPRALAVVRERFGDDVQDAASLVGRELAPGEKLRAVAVFQFRTGEGRFEERMDQIKLRFSGYADPVKKRGLAFTPENLELWMHYEKVGDEFDPYRESVRYLRSEEQVVE